MLCSLASQRAGVWERKMMHNTEVDPDFKLRRGPGFILLAQPAFLPSVVSSFFTQNKREAWSPWAPPLGPPL